MRKINKQKNGSKTKPIKMLEQQNLNDWKFTRENFIRFVSFYAFFEGVRRNIVKSFYCKLWQSVGKSLIFYRVEWKSVGSFWNWLVEVFEGSTVLYCKRGSGILMTLKSIFIWFILWDKVWDFKFKWDYWSHFLL